MGSNSLVLICLLLTASARGAVQQMTPDSLTSVFGSPPELITSSSLATGREYFILFYLPEVDASLELRSTFHQVSEHIERRNVESLKRRGVTEFQEIQRQLQAYIMLLEVDCGESQGVCELFMVSQYPTLFYVSKHGQVYSYHAHLNAQELLSFASRAEQFNNDPRILKPRQLKFHSTSFISRILQLANNQIVIYLLLFLVAPFLFGYCVMARAAQQPKQDIKNKTKKS